MAKEFEAFNIKYAKFAGTALKNIEKQGGSVAREDIINFTRWDHTFWSTSIKATNAQIAEAVYHCDTAEEWQKFRVSLKGLETKEKLYCLGYWLTSHDHSGVDHLRVANYIGALVRGGQLDGLLRVVR